MFNVLIKTGVKSTKSIFRQYFLRLVLLSTILSIFLLTLFWVAIIYGVKFCVSGLASYWEWGASILTGVGGIILSWFLLPIFIPFIAGFFQDSLISKIESQEYDNAVIKPEKLFRELIEGLKFVVRALGLNIICIPFYFIPVLNILLYYLLNGYLIGRELFIMVSRSYEGFKVAKQRYRKNKILIVISGMLLVLASNVPLVHLFIPLFGIVFMLHLYKLKIIN